MSDKTSHINLKIELDKTNIPERIFWQATDGPEEGYQAAKAVILSVWDAEARNSLRIDLWTKDMPIHDMDDFFYQTFLSLADTYERATHNKELMAEIKMFARDFADKRAKQLAKENPES